MLCWPFTQWLLRESVAQPIATARERDAGGERVRQQTPALSLSSILSPIRQILPVPCLLLNLALLQMGFA